MKHLLMGLILMICVPEDFFAQGSYRPKTKKKQFYGNQRLQKPLFNWVTGDYSRHGIQLSFGPNYTFTRISAIEETFAIGDSTVRCSQEPKGRLGAFVELGMVHITKRPRKYIHYFDWGIAYKHIGGREITRSDYYDDRDTLVGSFDGEGEFYNGHLSGRFSVHNVFQINPVTFLDNALGINFDYSFLGRNQDYDGYHLPQTQDFVGQFQGQLHYDFGFGFKPRDGFFVIPGFQVPLLTAYEWRNGNPSLHWFSSKYYPAHFKIKLVWLFKRDPNRCPPVETNEEDRKRSEEFMNR
jgi:hypothetical protein